MADQVTDSTNSQLQAALNALADTSDIDVFESEELSSMMAPLDETIVVSIPSALSDAGWKEVAPGKWARWPRTLANRAALILEATETPMTSEELLTIVGSASQSSLRQYLQLDGRFKRLDKEGRFALRTWEGEEYAGIVGAIRNRIQEGNGQASRTAIAEELPKLFGVSRTSVHAYLASDLFEIAGDVVTETPVKTYDPPDISKRADVVALGGLTAQRLQVTSRHLMGYSFHIPWSIASQNGIQPEMSLRVPVIWNGEPSEFQATVIWRWSSISRTVDIGRLRKALLANDVQADDMLLIAPAVGHCLVNSA